MSKEKIEKLKKRVKFSDNDEEQIHSASEYYDFDDMADKINEIIDYLNKEK